MDTKYEVIEKLSELEHNQWWKMRVSLFEKIEKQFTEITGCSNPYCQSYPSDEAKWDDLRDHNEYRPYSELSEEVKEHDRKWARQALEIVVKILEAKCKEIVQEYTKDELMGFQEAIDTIKNY